MRDSAKIATNSQKDAEFAHAHRIELCRSWSETTLGTDDCQGDWAVKDERQDTEEQGSLAQRARATSSDIEEALLMDGTQDTETHEVREQSRTTRRRFGSISSLFLIVGLAAALHGALFSAFDVIAPLEVDETENVVLIVDTPVHVSSFIADVR